MDTSRYFLKEFDYKNAPDQDWEALNQLLNKFRLETLPDDPPVATEQTKIIWTSLPPVMEHRIWVLWDAAGQQILGIGRLITPTTEENKQFAQFFIYIQNHLRGRGLACRLLKPMFEQAFQQGRSLAVMETSGNVPAGEAFASRLGLQAAMHGVSNQLKLKELDLSLLEVWTNRAAALSTDFELIFWDGPYPEDALAKMAELKLVMNQQPIGDLQVDEHRVTPELLRQEEASMAQRGDRRWTMLVRDRSNDRLAGYTEIIFISAKPEVVRQLDTGVLESYRNRGLGRWLKAAMLKKLVAEHPEVKFIRTQNADANAPMLKINNELGFKPYEAVTLWQGEMRSIKEYVQANGRK